MIENALWLKAPSGAEANCLEFSRRMCKKRVSRAVAYVSAFGMYELRINGNKVSDSLFTPGLTSYFNRIQYQIYDITDKLHEDSLVTIRCGKGWALSRQYGPYVNWDKNNTMRVIASFDVEYADGSRETIVTDESWSVYDSTVRDSELYDGETLDLTYVPKLLGGAEADVDFSPNLIREEGVRVREKERIAPVKLIITPKGEKVIDFGQNLAGYVEIRIKGERGDRIVVSHAEVLDKEGNFYTENYRTAKNINTYILSGGDDILKPTFCFQGYRYIRLDEFPTENIDLSCFTSVAVYSDIERTGYFNSGNRKINQLYSNILWGQKSNFLDIPTDCPQRDERFGWTGDAEIFCRTAAINYDVESFFAKWLGDVIAEQGEDGAVYGIVPARPKWGQNAGAAWGDAATICPWEIYQAYGDRELLRRHYPMMKKWVEYIHGAGDKDDEYLWIGDFQWADWLAMDAGDGIMFGATQNDLLASAYFAYSAKLCMKAAVALGESEDEKYYRELYEKIREAFRAAFMKDGMPLIYPKGDAFATNRPVKALTQTSICLILRFDLCDESEREALTEKLVELIRENDGCMTTGFVGTSHILHALSENGKTKEAYDLFLQEKNPSWLFSVNNGATTMWEHWDSMNENGDFWSVTMNSFNHYAYGAVCDWIFGVCAGIKVLDDGAGYTHISVSPIPDERLGYINYSINTRQGRLESAWRYVGEGRVRYELTVPENTIAELRLPSGRAQTLCKGSYVFEE